MNKGPGQTSCLVGIKGAIILCTKLKLSAPNIIPRTQIKGEMRKLSIY